MSIKTSTKMEQKFNIFSTNKMEFFTEILLLKCTVLYDVLYDTHFILTKLSTRTIHLQSITYNNNNNKNVNKYIGIFVREK